MTIRQAMEHMDERYKWFAEYGIMWNITNFLNGFLGICDEDKLIELAHDIRDGEKELMAHTIMAMAYREFLDRQELPFDDETGETIDECPAISEIGGYFGKFLAFNANNGLFDNLPKCKIG